MLQRILYSIKFAHKTKGNWYKDRIMRSDKSFQLKFGGDDTGIDAKFFAETIQNLSTLLNVAQSEIGTDTTSKLKITQTSAGSFCVDFSLFVETAVPLFFMLNTNGAQHIVKTFIEFIKFIKALKGEKPRSITQQGDKGIYSVITGNGNTVNITQPVYNLYCSSTAQTAAIKMVKDFGESGRTSLEFRDSEQETTISQDDVPNIKPDIFSEIGISGESKTTMVLPVRRPDLTGNGKWQMKYGEQFVHMTVTDKDFLDRVHSGQLPFAAGDQIECQLKIEYKSDPDGYPIPETQKFFIERVLRKIDNPVQMDIGV